MIYRDFKTSNILLDLECNDRPFDFGPKKGGLKGNKTHVSTQIRGTYGYAILKYVMIKHLISKSDVYSFGVVLLKLSTSQSSMDKNRPSGEHNLVA